MKSIQQTTNSNNYKFRFLIILFFSFLNGFGQTTITEPPLFVSNLSPNGLLENVFDRFGNHYKLSNISIKSNGIANSTLIECSQNSYFRLYFETGSGLKDTNNPIENARREVVCQVFRDLSKFINSPLTKSNNKVNIVFRDFKKINAFLIDNQRAVGSGFYNVPENTNGFVKGGIIENEVWKTIHTGIDSFKNVTPSIENNIESQTIGQFYHGIMAIDFKQNYNLDLSLNNEIVGTTLSVINPTAEYDLYSVVLRIAMHTLGLTSLIGSNGNSVFGAENNFYSRYDTHLSYNGQNLLEHRSNSCSVMYDYNFAVSENVLNPGCNEEPVTTNINSDTTICENAVIYIGETVGLIPVYTPNCFEPGLSLSHFEDLLYPNCATPFGNNNYFVNSNNIETNTFKRFLKPEERLALCELGYSVKTDFDFHRYKEEVCNGISVAGTNDGLTSENTFAYSGDENTNINITNILENDSNYDATLTNNLADLRFECVQDVYYPTTTANPVGNQSQITSNGNDANAIITFKSLIPGLHLLRYVPYNVVTGDRGNVSYVWVYLQISNCSGIPDLNPLEMVINGGFEQTDGGTLSISLNGFADGRVCNWNSPSIETPDCYSANLATFAGIPNGSFGPKNLNTALGANSGINYAGMFLAHINGYPVPAFSEMIKTKLKNPLLPNTTYTLKFDSSLSIKRPSVKKLQAFLTSQNIPSWLYGPIPNLYTASLPEINMLMTFPQSASTGSNVWDLNTITFTTPPCSSYEYLYLGLIKYDAANSLPYVLNDVIPFCATCNPNESYYFIDNVSIVQNSTTSPIYSLPSLNFPNKICNTDQPLNLTNLVINPSLNGVFSTSNVVVFNNGIYSLNPQTPYTGNYTISYTYTPSPDCPPKTITSVIEIVRCYQPFISQVYISGNNKYVEIKNKSQTGNIPSNANLKLLNYANSQNVLNAPSQFIDIGGFLPLETKVFKLQSSTLPPYASSAATANILTGFNFDGNNDLLVISTSANNSLAFTNRIDLVGNNTTWCVNKSLVRTSCASTFPKTTFDPEDWVEFSVAEANDGNSQTNTVLGRHNFDQLRWQGVPPNWFELDLSLSQPDRSRTTVMFKDYNTNPTGSFEACSLLVEGLVNVTVSPTTFIKVQSSVKVNPGGTLDIQNGGSLVMVKDSYNGISGPDLVQLNNGTVEIKKTTNGVNAFTDYVYWSSPLTANSALNQPLNSIANLFPPSMSTYERIYTSFNQNYYDGWNSQLGTSGGVGSDGDDDNLDFWHRLNFLDRSQLMTPGLGYVCYGQVADYNLNFKGQANNGIVNVPIFRNNSSYGENNNLVGNPYPSSIDLNRFFEVNKDLIDPVAFMWGRTPSDGLFNYPNPTVYGPISYSEDNYLIYNPSMLLLGNWASNNLPFNENGILASCQSFFIRARKLDRTTLLPIIPLNNTGQASNLLAGNLVFNNSMRSTSPLNTFARGSNSTTDTNTKLWLNLTDEKTNKTAQIGMAFLESATDNYNPDEDVQTITGRKLGFYSQTDKHDLIINTMGVFNKQKTINLGIVNLLENKSKLTIAVNDKTGELHNHQIFIYDNKIGKITNITLEPYQFDAEDQILDNRFTLLFQNKIETEITDVDQNKIVVFAKDGIVNVSSLTEKRIAAVYVFDLYTPSTSGIEIAKNENINNKLYSFKTDGSYKILNIQVLLEDGTIINKKIML